MMQKIKNIVQLGFKELRGLMRDPLLLGLILYTFTVGVYVAATATPDSISNAAGKKRRQCAAKAANYLRRRSPAPRWKWSPASRWPRRRLPL